MPEDYLTPATGNVRILAEPCLGKDLKPGELFSVMPPSYWDQFDRMDGVGERVYIRTNTPCPIGQEYEPIYRITIIKE